jgi:hypothetical protein
MQNSLIKCLRVKRRGHLNSRTSPHVENTVYSSDCSFLKKWNFKQLGTNKVQTSCWLHWYGIKTQIKHSMGIVAADNPICRASPKDMRVVSLIKLQNWNLYMYNNVVLLNCGSKSAIPHTVAAARRVLDGRCSSPHH